jgi:hypothetical protein
LRPRVTSPRHIPFAARVGGLVNEELARGADPVELSMLLIELGLQTGKQDPSSSYESLTELAGRLRELATRMRS